MNRVNLLDNRITLINGDCLEILPKVKPACIDMVFADLPYGTTQNKWDSIIPLDRLWVLLKNTSRLTTSYVMTAQIPFSITLAYSNLPMLKYEWVWRKQQGTGHLNSKRQPLRDHENILVFYDKQCTYNPQMTYGHKAYRGVYYDNAPTTENYGTQRSGKNGSDGSRYPTTASLQFVNSQVKRGDRTNNATQKPVELLEYLIKTYTNENDVVLDPTAGSCTTAVACINTNRRCIAIEKDADYFQIGVKRCEDAINARQ